MADTATTLRAELARCRPERASIGFPAALRRRAGRWLSGQQALGSSWTTLGRALGISPTTARQWGLAIEAGSPDPEAGFLPVVVDEGQPGVGLTAGPVLHTPHGYRVTGLQPEELLAVLRGLE